MNKLFIAEKHDVAKAIADVLGITGKGGGYYECGDSSVTWCAGHMLELCTPEDYNEKHGKWVLKDLPIVNIPWQYKVIRGRGKQLKVIQSLMKQAATIVHAGDTDGEGQLLVDIILKYYHIDKPVKRILINDNNPKIIRRALDNLRDNREFFGLSQSALARSVGDQLYGFNMTRLYTLKVREKGAQGVYSVGRVQTPILGLIVNRDRAIAAHSKHFYYLLKGVFRFDTLTFSALCQAPDDAPTDDKGRVTDSDYLQVVATACTKQPAVIRNADTRGKIEHPPLPYDLLDLQADAFRKFGIKPDKTLALTQRLREKRLITYNRSDCRYLSDEQHDDAPAVLATIARNAPMLAHHSQQADTSIKARCFNSDHVTAHHAIIPTEGRGDIAALSEHEKQLYLLIARAYIAQFWPLKKSNVTTVMVGCGGHTFKATYTAVIEAGWSQLYKNDTDNDDVHTKASDDASKDNLSVLHKDDQGQCLSADAEQKETKPPKHYTMATLLKDLKHVAKYVKDPKIAQLLRDKDKDKKGEQGGIGTPATRDSFIVKLQERGYIEEKGKHLLSTRLGQAFYDALPEMATQPDMTALWHAQQKDIEAGALATEDFLHALVEDITAHVDEISPGELAIQVEGGAP